MESNDSKFFESLVGGGGARPPVNEYEIELAKASSNSLARAAKAPRARDYEGEPEGQLTVDVYQTPDDIVIESAIAGIKPEDIDVNVTNDSISIKGARHREEKEEGADYLYQECYWGRFGRSIILPQEVDPESADVTFRNGILTVRLPKVNKSRARKLRVKID